MYMKIKEALNVQIGKDHQNIMLSKKSKVSNEGYIILCFP